MNESKTEELVESLRLLAASIERVRPSTAAILSGAADKIEYMALKPVCPVCKAEMRPRKYEGYYDSFDYWECDCESLPNADAWQGANNDC